MNRRHAAIMLPALAVALAASTPHRYSGGVDTQRKGEARKRRSKPLWLQDRLVARAAEKRARKAAKR